MFHLACPPISSFYHRIVQETYYTLKYFTSINHRIYQGFFSQRKSFLVHKKKSLFRSEHDSYTVNLEFFSSVLFSQYFAYGKFRVNKTSEMAKALCLLLMNVNYAKVANFFT